MLNGLRKSANKVESFGLNSGSIVNFYYAVYCVLTICVIRSLSNGSFEDQEPINLTGELSTAYQSILGERHMTQIVQMVYHGETHAEHSYGYFCIRIYLVRMPVPCGTVCTIAALVNWSNSARTGLTGVLFGSAFNTACRRVKSRYRISRG